jgi:hypothetical protein
MGLFDFFKKKKKQDDVDVVGHSLDDVGIGGIIELDGESWEVVDKGYYDYGGEKELDLKIQSPTREGFLNKDEEGIYFFVRENMKKLSLNPIEFLKTHDDLPSEIEFDNSLYRLQYSSAAYYVKGNNRSPVVIWDFEDTEGNILEILQWGDEEFEIFSGRRLEEWEIEDVLSKK